MSELVQREINNLKKQNDGMEASLKNKGIQFTKLSIDVDGTDTELMLMREYNNYLKEISKNNKPEPKPKEQSKPKEQIKPKDDDENEDELTNEVKIDFPTICNMEELKRFFFAKDYEQFEMLVKTNKLHIFKANYKWADDNDGKPDYVARNRLRGFVQSLDDYRKYFMVCFRCILTNVDEKKYKYPSYWIVNTDVSLNNVLGSSCDDYDFIRVESDVDVNKLLTKMRKNEDENDTNMIGEMYVH